METALKIGDTVSLNGYPRLIMQDMPSQKTLLECGCKKIKDCSEMDIQDAFSCAFTVSLHSCLEDYENSLTHSMEMRPMSATVAAVLKKIAVSLLTNPKILKTVLGIVLGIIIIIIMPIVAIVSIFNGGIEIDTDRLQTMVVEKSLCRGTAKAAVC